MLKSKSLLVFKRIIPKEKIFLLPQHSPSLKNLFSNPFIYKFSSDDGKKPDGFIIF